MGQYYRANLLVQCWPTKIRIILQIFFQCKVVHGLWVNIAQVIFLCNAVSDIFGQHWQDNIPMQCCPVPVWLIQHCLGYFFIKIVCLPWANITQVISLCNVDPERSRTIVDYFPLQSCLWTVQWWVGEMIDPLAASKYIFFNFQGFFLLGSNVLECAYYLFCIDRFT